MDTSPDHAKAPPEQDNSGWGPLDALCSLGRAASIAAGASGTRADEEFRGFRIAVTGRDGAYFASITHHLGKAIRLPAPLRDQFDAARFANPGEAAQHARFLIASGALNHITG